MGNSLAYLVPFSHLDLYWLGEREECLSRGNMIITSAIEIAEKYPEFRFLIEDIVFVDYFIKSHPEQHGVLKELIHKGQIEIGPKWAGIHQDVQCGEDLVRNTLYAKQYTRENFDFEASTIHLGDLPGWTPQYPQIAKKAEMDSLVLTRCGPRDKDLFRWQALDGSSDVMVWHSYFGYAWAISAKLHVSVEEAKKAELDKQMEQIAARCPAPIFVHWGVDLSAPPEQLCKSVAEWNESEDIKLEFATPMEYFGKVKDTEGLSVLQGEVPSAWPFIESILPDMVPLDVPANNRLMAAEKFATIANLMGYMPYPKEQIRTAWLKLMEGMDHNYNGTGSVDTHIRKRKYRQYALETAEEILSISVRSIAENVEVKAEGREKNPAIPVVVFNPLSWQREDIAQVHMSFYGDVSAFNRSGYDKYRILDETGAEVPFQEVRRKDAITREVEVAFVADVPSIGYSTYYLVASDEDAVAEETCQVKRESGISTFSNWCYDLEINEITGEISIRDNRFEQQILNGGKVIAVEESRRRSPFRCAYTGRKFEACIDSVRLEENGPVRTVVVLEGKILDSTLEQRIILYNKLDRIDIVDSLTWNNDKPIIVQQRFPLCVEPGLIQYGTAYGSNSFDNTLPGCEAKRGDEATMEMWFKQRFCQGWIDVSGQDFGVTISSDRREFEIKDSSIRSDMLRTLRLTCPTHCVSRYSIRSHKGDFKSARSFQDGWQLNNPLIAKSVSDPVSSKTLPARQSFCEIPGDSIVATVLKKSEDDDDIILRLFETAGDNARTEVKFFKPVSRTAEVNLLERNDEGLSSPEMEVAPFEIKTVKMSLQKKT
ncbi:glycosyl hydrolase-related protein [Candidatus Poribacteria bacterium]